MNNPSTTHRPTKRLGNHVVIGGLQSQTGTIFNGRQGIIVELQNESHRVAVLPFSTDDDIPEKPATLHLSTLKPASSPRDGDRNARYVNEAIKYAHTVLPKKAQLALEILHTVREAVGMDISRSLSFHLLTTMAESAHAASEHAEAAEILRFVLATPWTHFFTKRMRRHKLRHDLCEALALNGQLSEALVVARRIQKRLRRGKDSGNTRALSLSALRTSQKEARFRQHICLPLICEEILEIEPNDGTALWDLGDDRVSNCDFDAAVKFFRQTLHKGTGISKSFRTNVEKDLEIAIEQRGRQRDLRRKRTIWNLFSTNQLRKKL